MVNTPKKTLEPCFLYRTNAEKLLKYNTILSEHPLKNALSGLFNLEISQKTADFVAGEFMEIHKILEKKENYSETN
jgi:hypothetical protein